MRLACGYRKQQRGQDGAYYTQLRAYELAKARPRPSRFVPSANWIVP